MSKKGIAITLIVCVISLIFSMIAIFVSLNWFSNKEKSASEIFDEAMFYTVEVKAISNEKGVGDLFLEKGESFDYCVYGIGNNSSADIWIEYANGSYHYISDVATEDNSTFFDSLSGRNLSYSNRNLSRHSF